jgi:prepilin-type N-terminal cleavage/methylation domain-containing protein/prepilin-type processing-associated H-X9-DG protein
MTFGRKALHCSRVSPGQKHATPQLPSALNIHRHLTGLSTAPPPSAFSLIELLAVVAILLIITTLYWGGKSGSREKQKQAVCSQNLEKLFISLEIYANEHVAKFPEKIGATNSAQVLDLLVPKYTADTSMFICPASKDAPLPGGQSIAPQQISYAYYMGRQSKDPQDALLTDKQINNLSKTQGQVAFSTTGKPPGDNHGKLGGNVLFCDGHADVSTPISAFSLVLTQGVVLLNP